MRHACIQHMCCLVSPLSATLPSQAQLASSHTHVPCTGAKLFYLSGLRNGKYLKREVLNLARFISIMKLRPLSWRSAHPYLLTDRFEVRRK